MTSLLFRASRCFTPVRVYTTSRHFTLTKVESRSDATAIRHSRFLAEEPPDAHWSKGNHELGDGNGNGNGTDDFEGVGDRTGKLAPTSSHLFKLILPLGTLSHPGSLRLKPSKDSPNAEDSKEKSPMKPPTPPPTVFLLHPSQPLSHVAKLILSSLSPATPVVSFRSISSHGKAFQWSDSTDIGDFIRDAAKGEEFRIVLTYGSFIESQNPATQQGASRYIPVDYREDDTETRESDSNGEIKETVLKVQVPTFTARTRFLRRRLQGINKQIEEMEDLKRICDDEAHRGAKRLALGGFGMLVVYWATVARLTFWDLGWDIMEPVTYLSGLTMVILGYLWFLYQGREVSYSSVLNRSISTRRETLYRAKGFDVEQWMTLITERKELLREIGRIAEDYDKNFKRRSNGTADDEEVGEEMQRKHEHNGGRVTKEEEHRATEKFLGRGD